MHFCVQLWCNQLPDIFPRLASWNITECAHTCTYIQRCQNTPEFLLILGKKCNITVTLFKLWKNKMFEFGREKKQAKQTCRDKTYIIKQTIEHFRHSYKDCRPEGSSYVKVTSVDYHKHTHILVTGLQDGSFFLHEMPDFNLIHSLK